jgi:hypothetical protein
MSGRRDPSPEPSTDVRPSAPSALHICARASQSDPHIEDYLDHFCVPLVGRVPYAARATLRSQLRTHLEALVDARLELGWGRDEAVRHALTKFGDPRVLGRKWLREWRCTALAAPVPSARPATLVAVRCFGAATIVAIALMMLAMGRPISPLLGDLLGLILAIVIPLLAGILTGWVAPTRQALGSFYALSLVVVPTTLGSACLWHSTRCDDVPFSGVILGIMQVLFWLPIGCASAALGGWLRTLRERAPRWMLPA